MIAAEAPSLLAVTAAFVFGEHLAKLHDHDACCPLSSWLLTSWCPSTCPAQCQMSDHEHTTVLLGHRSADRSQDSAGNGFPWTPAISAALYRPEHHRDDAARSLL
jgi:hypothetical protein